MSRASIFISYARVDGAYVRRLAAVLSRAGVDTWFDHDMSTGDAWEAVLRERIYHCAAVLVVMTPAAEASKWVAWEVEYARMLGKPLLPLLLEGPIIFGLDPVHVCDVRDSALPAPALVDRWRGIAPLRRVIRHQIGLVPAIADCFQLRAVADDLNGALSMDSAATLTETSNSTQILVGSGGVGKTQLAAAIATRMRDAGELDLLVWVNARSADGILTGYAQAAIEVVGADPGDPVKATTAFLAHLAVITGQWLVVLDDLSNPADLDGWWPPRTSTGRVVVTTRRRDAALATHGRMVPVDLFTPTESHAYLRAKFQRDPYRMEQANELAEDLGHLPVALAQAAAYIVDRDLTCAHYRSRLLALRLADLTPSAWPDEYAMSVAATVSLAVDAADQLEPIGLARPLLLMLSLLDPNGIPAEVVGTSAVTALLRRTGRDSVDADAASDALACLSRLSVAAVSGENLLEERSSSARRIHVHALIQKAIRDQATTEEVSAAAAAAADGLLEIWPPVERDTEFAQVLRSSAEALLSCAEAHIWQPAGQKLLLRAGDSLGDAGLLVNAIRHFQRLTAEFTIRLGPAHDVTLMARLDLADWQLRAGDTAAALNAQQTLIADYVRVLGEYDPRTLDTRHKFARWRGIAGDPAGAANAYEALLTDRIRVLGPYYPDTLVTRNSLARWRGRAGDPHGASEQLSQVVADHIAILGPDHPDTLAARNNLAFWQGKAGDVTGALTAFRALLPDRLRVLGPDHPGTLTTRGNLARLEGEAGNATAAMRSFQTLLADRLRVLGPDHPDTLTTRNNLAYWKGQAGKPEEAIQDLQELLPDRLRILGPDHPDTLTTRSNLATILGDAGDPVAALAAHLTVLKDRLRVLGLNNPSTRETVGRVRQWRSIVRSSAGRI